MEKIRSSHDNCTKNPISALRSAHPYRGKSGPLFCMGLVLLLTGCSIAQLAAFKKQADEGDFVRIAAQTVACDHASPVCAELHLIKGEACAHVAAADPAPADKYACAADELAKGLALMPAWTDTVFHRRYQEMYCESLRQLQALRTGQEASRNLTRLMNAAEGLYQLAPGSVPAVYYLASARLGQIQPILEQIDPASRIPVCNRLKRTVTGVLSKMETAATAPTEDWNRFADRYQRLSFDLGAAMRVAGCR